MINRPRIYHFIDETLGYDFRDDSQAGKEMRLMKTGFFIVLAFGILLIIFILGSNL